MTATSVRPPAQRAAPGQDRRLARPALAAVLLGVLGVGALATIGLWCWDTPFGGVHGTGGALTAAGRITGLAGGYLLVVEVALMARTPWLEERVGADWLARVHRSLGEYTVILIVSHAVLLILGSALTSHTSVLSAGVTMVFQYEDVLKATLATGLLVGIGVLSARAVRRRLRYETWQATHVLAYLAVLLGFFHQTSIGFDLSSPVAKVGWTGLHLLVGGAALWWRVIAPLRLSLRHGFTVAGVLAEAPGTVSVVITGNRLDELNAEPGQFFRWRFLSRDRWWQAHPFSLSAAPQANGLRITVKALGDHTADLGALRPGTRVLAEGPYGAITPKLFGNRRLLLIGGGVGITPLRALLDAVRPCRPGTAPGPL